MTNSLAQTDKFLVCIGVSTDELLGLETFFAHLPENSNAIFVVIQHQSSKTTSLLEGVLRHHSKMVVFAWEEGMQLLSNRVYWVPSHRVLKVENQQLHLVADEEMALGEIDGCFQALAELWGDRTIGILFAGTGNDGTQGLQAIAHAGGVTFFQSLETGELSSPTERQTPFDLADETLSPQALASLVYDLVYFAKSTQTTQLATTSPITPDQLQRILSILTDRQQLNYAHYKISTLNRRIAHRYALSKQPSLDSYINHLSNNPEEQYRLCQDLMIGVTSFFRDVAAWEFLATQTLPQLLDNLAPEEPLRIWVTACATGEEVYSIAMLVDEAIGQRSQRIGIKIFATDIDAEALEKASKGIYPATIANQISPERLGRYFTHAGDRFQVVRSLREMVIFSAHDLTQNVGFSQMHLVTCRNVLIYMQPTLQQQILRLLHFALVPQGVLFLGSSETLGELETEFIPLSNKWKFFQKRRDVRLPIAAIPRQSLIANVPFLPGAKDRPTQFDRLLSEVFQFCFQGYQMTCLLVNQDNLLVHIFENSAQLLEFPLGQTRLDVTSMVLAELRLPLSIALHKVKRDRQSVCTQIPLLRDGKNYSVTLRISYQPNNLVIGNHLIVVFDLERSTVEHSSLSTFAISPEITHQIAALEYELKQTHDSLQIAIENLETTNEELQATNEELLAANEELQSVNEELQATNEELFAVNIAHQQKIEALTQLTNDVDNLLCSTNLGVIFLDRDLNLRKFTPIATQIINIRTTDINRPITHFTHNLNCDNMLELLWQVVSTEKSLEQEVILTTTGSHLLMSLSPYTQENGGCDGVVMTFVGINELKAVQNRLQQNVEQLERLYAATPVGLAVIDDQFTYVKVNDPLAKINGFTLAQELLGKSVFEILPNFAESIIALCQQVLTTGQALLPLETTAPHPNRPNTQGTWLCSYYPVQLVDGQRAVGVTVMDITDRKQAEQLLADYQQTLETQVAERTTALQQTEARYGNLVANMPGVVYRYLLRADGSDKVLYMSPGCRDLWELEPQQIEENVNLLWAMIHPEDLPKVQAAIQVSAQTGQPWHWEWRIVLPTGEFKWLRGAARPERHANGDVIWDGLVLNITARKQMEELFQSLLVNIPGAVLRYILHPDGSDQVTYLNPGCYELLEVEANQVEQDASLLWQMVHPEDLPAMKAAAAKSAQTLRPWSWQWRAITPSGRLKWMQGSGRPQRYPNGDVVWDTIVLDVTELKQAEAQLVELEELNRLKDEFLSTVSHELRTPITNIKMSVKMLEISLDNDRGAEAITHYLSILKQETKREADLINDLLELSRLNANFHEPSLSSLDLPAWIPHLVAPFHDRLVTQEQTLVLDFPPDLPALTTDTALLERVLNELINNACKYSPRNATITIAAVVANSGIDLSVTNTGVEIPTQECDRVFERFYRVPKHDPWKYGGTGLGLAIVKKLVDHLGGTLTLDTGNNQTQFTLHLPYIVS